MASPSSFMQRPIAPPQSTTGPTPGKKTAVSNDSGVPNADRIPPYVGAIIIVSAIMLVGLHRLKFRMIVGAG